MTFEDHQSMSLEKQLDYGISQALALMSTMDAVIVTDQEGRHWEVDPQDILPSANDDQQTPDRAAGFAENRRPFDHDDD